MNLTVIGGGLAGCEAAWQAAERGAQVTLYEMRPAVQTGAHVSGDLAELVCSNSLGSKLIDRASGMLGEELRRLGSLLLTCAEASALPAGGALAVDRVGFARHVSAAIEAHPKIRVVRQEVTALPDTPTIIAAGPLASPALTAALAQRTGQDNLYFYDAISPVIYAESIDRAIVYRASRYDEGAAGDYLNCPLDEGQYNALVQALVSAERIPLREFETPIKSGVQAGAKRYFEGCLPIEVLAGRNPRAAAYGPMRPVGLTDPRTGDWPHAVVQLRQDNLAASLYNLVGFQTNLTFAEQKRVLRTIPGLERAEIARYGQMHRNTFIHAPSVLSPTLQMLDAPHLWLAGQITGVEGYLGNIATGLLAGVNAARTLAGAAGYVLPRETMLGGLVYTITHAAPQDFQPVKAHYGVLPVIENPNRVKRERGLQYTQRGLAALDAWLAANDFLTEAVQDE